MGGWVDIREFTETRSKSIEPIKEMG